MTYATQIAKIVGPKIDPRHVEAYMRSVRGTLNGLSSGQFRIEAIVCADIVRKDVRQAERLAQSYGL